MQMQVDINKIIEIYSQKLANSEKENVILQAQVVQSHTEKEILETRIEELKSTHKKALDKLNTELEVKETTKNVKCEDNK
ncbi:hypothetical protein [Terrisporobacter sp.]|uniref:hypothetical protein n=1 Tax=Terrisporobacter sp. TaxID=1965305 RepID=UPI00289B0BC3|nr:hypothetical protein [Terrisporobacter sp.]